MPSVPEAGQWGVTALLAALIGGGGVWTYLSARFKARADAPAQITGAQAQMAAALAQSVDLILKGYQKQCDRWSLEVGELRDEAGELRGRVEVLEAEKTECEQRLEFLTSRLHAAGIDLTAAELPGSLIELRDGQATVLTAPNRLPRR